MIITIRSGIGGLAMLVSRELIASGDWKKLAGPLYLETDFLEKYILRCLRHYPSLGGLCHDDMRAVTDLIFFFVGFVKDAESHPSSCKVLCQHFAAISAAQQEPARPRSDRERIADEIMQVYDRHHPGFDEMYISRLVDARMAEIERERQAKEAKTHEGYRNMGPITDEDIREQIGLPRAGGPGLIRRMFRALWGTFPTGQRPSKPALSEA